MEHNKMPLIEKIIFGARYILVIFAIGLLLALIPYGIGFLIELYMYCKECYSMTIENRTLGILDLADSMMVGNVIYLLAAGSFSVFGIRACVKTLMTQYFLNTL